MFGLFDYGNDETVFIKHFYNSPFRGDPMQEELRDRKVAKVIKSMGDKYVLAKPIKRLTTQEK